jgi:hypothetical protein
LPYHFILFVKQSQKINDAGKETSFKKAQKLEEVNQVKISDYYVKIHDANYTYKA